MTDQADEIARDIVVDITFKPDIDWLAPEIAAALRSYRNEGLEEAVKNVLGWRECDWPQGFDRWTAETMAQDRAERIRSLKSKEPQG